MKTILKVFPFYNVFIAFESISFDTTDAFHLISLHADVNVKKTHFNISMFNCISEITLPLILVAHRISKILY